MTYRTDHIHTAGKITVYTTIVGVFTFLVIFLLNVTTAPPATVSAQDTATTSVTVLNTPPAWNVDAEEEVESSTSSPTNAGDEVAWVGTGEDANGEDYYLLICSNNATPTANSSAAPECHSSAVQWAVSTATISGTEARAATTTLASFSESNDWYAFICDDNTTNPRCNSDDTQQGNGSTASPFEVNHRPTFTAYTDTSPADPGAQVVFHSTSSDSDTSGAQDTVRLFVCNTNSFSTTTDTCTGTTLASTSVGVTNDASATYTISIPTQDQNYAAFGFVVDNHGFEASGGSQGTDSVLTVSNVAPTVGTSTITLNDGLDMALTVESGETTGFTLEFVVSDNNSCENASSGDEIVDYDLSIYRSGVGSTTCTNAAGDYDANNCYPSDLATTTWNHSCTASSTSCTGSSDTSQVWNCTFPLWYIADPTDAGTQFPGENWLTQIRAIDDDAATGPFAEDADGVEVTSFLAFALNTLSIPYGSLEPGQRTDPISATTTLAATGNVGLDTSASGTSMCTSFSPSSPCPNSSTSTIQDNKQVFGTSTVAYGTASTSGDFLSSTTAKEIEINVPKTRSTSTASTSDAYWGIEVPSSITFAGDYTGQNVFTAIVGESSDW